MSDPFEFYFDQFKQTLIDCRDLYVNSARLCVQQYPDLIPHPRSNFVQLMDDLHRGLLIKTFASISEADKRWSGPERKLAQELFLHVWGQLLTGRELRDAILGVSQHAITLSWLSLVRPFAEIEPLREQIGKLETIVVRLSNLVAKSDGTLTQSEANVLASIRDELNRHLRAIPFDSDHETADRTGSQAVTHMQKEISTVRTTYTLKPIPNQVAALDPDDDPIPIPGDPLKEAMAELDGLIGMEGIKEEVRSLTNFILMQRQRREADLPELKLSLHTVFTGNPGTGKTTVARIVGHILGAMGILKKGHVVETDRSGLVAEYAGQTAPKTNKKIDEALDGILFIDEAYSLVGEGTEDNYGNEAVQTLLKRMEDDRDRLVVVLAGYPEPIDRLLKSNPGLSSRFSRNIHFEDYPPSDLGRILQSICDSNHYDLPAITRAKFLSAMTWLCAHKDEHFGNGRLVRNAFENAVRRLANRIASVAPVTKEMLTRFEAEDLQFDDVPDSAVDDLANARFTLQCSECERESKIGLEMLAKRVKCPCGHRFVADWCELVQA